MRRTKFVLIVLALLFVLSSNSWAVRGYVGNFVHRGASGFDVTAYGAKGDGTTDDSTAFTNAIAAAAGGRVIVPEAATSYKLSANVTVPAGVTIEFQQGGLLSIDNTFTFTVSGTLEAGLYQIFSGAGTVTIAGNSCEHVLPQWWGALGDDSNDDTAEIQAAITALANGGIIKLVSGTYKTTAALTLSNSGVILEGDARRLGSSIKVYGAAVNGVEVTGSDCLIRDIRVLPDVVNSGSGIKIDTGKRNAIENVMVGASTDTKYFDKGVEISGEAYYTSLRRLWSRYNTYNVYLHDGGGANGPNATTFMDCQTSDGSWGIYIKEGGAVRIIGNQIENFDDTGIEIVSPDPGDHQMIIGNRFESNSGKTPVKLGTDVNQVKILGNSFGYSNAAPVEDNSGQSWNQNDGKITFSHQGLTGTVADDYGGYIELSEDGSDPTDLKMEATTGDLQLATSNSGSVIDLQSDTEVADGKRFDMLYAGLFTPGGGFGERVENRLTYSEDWSNAAWSKTNITQTSDSATAPNGRATADTLTSTATSAYSRQTLNGGSAIDGSVTPVNFRGAVWARAVSGTVTNFRLRLRSSGTHSLNVNQNFNLTTAWQLCEVTGTLSANEICYFDIYPKYGGTDSVYVWGAQVVYGDDSSRIPYVKTADSVISVGSPALVAADSFVAGGDIDASGGFRQSFSFMQSDVAASQTSVAIDILGLAGNTEYTMPKDGSVVGVSIASNAARSAGTLTVDAAINGTATGLQAVLDGSNTQYHYGTQSKDTDAFSAGDRLTVEITTDASWAPTTADVVVTVIVEM